MCFMELLCDDKEPYTQGNSNMNSIGKALFEAIHKGKWLSIVYKNQSEQITKYWIAVKTLSPQNGRMQVDGLHLGRLTVQELYIRVERIISAEVIEGSWCEINEALVQDIMENPRKYEVLFGNTANLRVLEYLVDCHKLDSTPYKTGIFLDFTAGSGSASRGCAGPE